MKKRKFIIRFLLGFLFFILLLPVFLFFVIQIKPVQNFLKDKIMQIASEQFNSNILIGRIYIHAPFDVVVEDFFLQDYQKDTLISAGILRVRPQYISLKKNKYIVDKVELINSRFEYRVDSTGFSNLDFFLENFSSSDDDDDDENSDPPTFNLNNLDLKNVSVFYCTQEKDSVPSQMDLDTINITNLNLNVSDFVYENEAIALNIDTFCFDEQSGFKVRNIASEIYYDKRKIELTNFNFKLNKTDILFDQIKLNYNNISDLSENPQMVLANIDLNNKSTINFSDLGYFSDKLKNYNEKVKIGFNLSGSLKHLVSSRFFFRYRNGTKLNAEFEVFGLPDKDKIYFDFKFKKLEADLAELMALKNPLDSGKPFFELPEKYNIPQNLKFEGKTNGKIDDFMFFGKLTSSAGVFFADVQVKLDSLNKNIIGNVQTYDLDIGHILDNKKLGKISMTDTIDLLIQDSSISRGYNQTHIFYVDFNDYRYYNIRGDINFIKDSAEAIVAIADTNFRANIDGAIKFDGANTQSKFNIDIDTVRFAPLNFLDDEYAALSVAFKGEFKGNNFDNIEGNFTLKKQLNLIKNLQSLIVDEFDLDISNTIINDSNNLKKIELQSELLDGTIEGIYDIGKLAAFGKKLAYNYFPSLNNDSIVDLFCKNDEIGNRLDFNIKILDIEPITNIFAPTIHIARNAKVVGQINSKKELFKLNIDMDSLIVSGNKLQNLQFKISGNSDELTTNLDCGFIGISDFRIENFSVKNINKNDTANLKINWHNDTEMKNYGQISSDFIIKNDTSGNIFYNLKINKDTIYLNNESWTLFSENICLDTTGIDVEKIQICNALNDNKKQLISIYGKASKEDTDTIHLNLQHFDISQLNVFLPKIKLGGFMNSDITTSNLLDTPKIMMNSDIAKFTINDVEIGEIKQKIEWIEDEQALYTELLVQKHSKTPILDSAELARKRALLVKGKYFVKTESFDFDIDLRKMKIKPFAPYLDEYVKFSRRANVNGYLRIKGDKIIYDVAGKLSLYGAFLFPATGVKYTLNGGMNIFLEKDKIILDTTILIGPHLTGDAMLCGNISHKNFSNPYVEMYLRADTIAFMDLPRTNQSKYYGKIVASGDVDISGYPQDLNVMANIITENNTTFTLLLDRPSEVSNKTSIVTFVSPQDTIFTETAEDESTSNLNIDLSLDLNPAAKFKIIFNEMTGEAIDIQGDGNVSVQKNALGDLMVSGKISIVKGLYNFVLENIAKREFKIKKGSSIDFKGDISEGILDVATVYSVKNVSLYNLLISEEYMNQKTQADCYINLDGQIMNPKIKFSVELPKADQRIATQMSNLDAANMNKQFLSLLIFRRFQPLPGLSFDPSVDMAAGGAFNAGELISNQLNALLSNINSDVELDVNYVTGNEQVSDQFDVAMSVPILNERVTINTDVGVGGNNTGTSNQNNFIGDFEVDVKLNKKGNIILKAFNKTNRNEFYDRGLYTQGVGILYKRNFNHFFPRNKKKISLDSVPPKADTTKLKHQIID